MRALFQSASAIALVLASAGARADEAPVGAPDEIVVTGEKVARSLQETTASVGVVTAARLEEETIQSLSDVFQRTVNVSETYGSSGFTIRGISNRGVSGGGDAATATVFVDGAPLVREIVSNGPTDMWDVAQVEIFRGPQSTLQGLNALAGAIIIRTQDPTMDWSAKGRAILSSHSTRSLAVAGGGPIIQDELAFRVSAEKRDSDGEVWNPTRDAPESPIDTIQLRAKLLWTPSAIPGFEARANYQHYKGDTGYNWTYVDTSTPDFFDNRQNLSDAANSSSTNADQATLDLRQDLGGGFSLTSLTTYTNVDSIQSYDGDQTAESLSWGANWINSDTVTQEIRLNYDSERLSGLVGLYYYNRDQSLGSASQALVPTPERTIAALLQGGGLDPATAAYLASVYVAALPEIPVAYSSDGSSKVETFAIFADGRFRFNDRLSLLAGFRFDREKNRFGVDQSAVFNGTYPDPAAFGPFGPAIAAINAGVDGLVSSASGNVPPASRTFNAFLPKLGLNMDWTDDLSTAFVIQRGYRSGGSSMNTARSQSFAYDPEYTWNYELSLRSAWLDGRLTVNANAYYVDWKDQQANVNFGLNLYDYHTVNAGTSHLYGFEIEAAHRVSEAFDWYMGVGNNNTRFDDFQTDVGVITDLSGLEFTYAPRWTLSAGANARFGGGFNANLNANYRSAVYTDVAKPQSDWRVGARTIVNTRLGYQADHWSASLFVNNLLDEQYMQYQNPSLQVGVLGAGRTVGVVLEAGF